MNETELLGFKVLCGGRTEILDYLWRRYGQGLCTHVLTLNPEIAMQARNDAAVQDMLRKADACVADGVGIEWAAAVLGRPCVRRYPGIELVGDLASRLAADGEAVFLLGSQPGVAAEAGARLAAQHPGLRIGGCRDGYFKPDEEPQLTVDIAASKSAMLLVGMGCPRQEEFIVRHREALGVPLMVGVGGAFEVFAGRKRRAPEFVKRTGLEWAYRTTQDLSRLKRLGVLPKFVLQVLGEAWQAKRRKAA